MCGINGIFTNKSTITGYILNRMNDLLSHRGPDGNGIWINSSKNVGLGHTRLSILDLSNSGSQPMSDSTGQITIVFNGEVYNYVELKKDLENDGVIFNSGTDTEVIIYLFKKYGIKCVEMLRGMFAFCIYDSKSKKAYLARDRVGKKPIIYSYNKSKGIFVFSSEIKPVIENYGYKKEIDVDGLNHYLSHVYFHVPAPYTIFKNVSKLEPASYIEFDLKSFKLSEKRYWVPDYTDEFSGSFDDAKREFVELAKDCVQIRERSDVPVGILLSGGLDSSTILAMMENKNIHSFAIGYDKDDPEIHRARIVSKKFKTKHHELFFKETGFKYLPELINRAGEPFNVPSALYAMQLSEQIHKAKIKVVMNGAGADEVFCGYSHHNDLLLLNRIFVLKKILGKGFFKLFDRKGIPNNLFFQFIRFMSIDNSKTKGELYRVGQLKISSMIYSQKFKKAISAQDVGKLIDDNFNLTKTSDTFRKHFYTDLSLANAHSMTYFSDITGMAYSLEIRSPFLDHKLIEFGGRIPNKYKLKLFCKKYNKLIMKKAAEDYLPHEIIYAKKMGFGYNIRLHNLFRNELKQEVYDRLFRGNIESTGLFNMESIKKLYNLHVSGKENHGILLMALVCFDEWYEQYMK